MNYRLLWNTVKHLKPTQVFYQVKYRLKKPALVQLCAPDSVKGKLAAEPIPKFKCVEGNVFTFLNLGHEFLRPDGGKRAELERAGWNFTDNGMLWAYNLNYMDWLCQSVNCEEIIDKSEGEYWIDRFIDELPNNRIGLDPYPIALRSINWVKFFCRYPESATKSRLDSLYSQVKLLEKKLEYHLLGNHLLEDAYALYICACYFGDEKLLKKASKLLKGQLEGQILPDGAHYEQSPMYHCILLDRLLDCINICQGSRVKGQDDVRCLSEYAVRMLGHLDSIMWTDRTIPLLNDSAQGIAPSPNQIFDYAIRLGLEWSLIPMKECGYRKLKDGHLEAIIDVGDITATYQPGHTHADALNYELRLEGKPIVVDCGVSTYNKTQRRQYERSTIAHNCVSPNEKNSSEVWGGFRVGKRCHTVIKEDSGNVIEAIHDGFEKPCRRRFEMTSGGLVVEDWYDGEAVSYVHLAEGADESRVKVDGTKEIEIKPCKYSTEYNRFHNGKVMEIHFNGKLKYEIR